MFDRESALTLAKRHVLDGSMLVEEQSARVSRMEPDSPQQLLAKSLLAAMNATLQIFVDDAARLERPTRLKP